MFVRVKSTPNSPRQSVQLVESVRHGDKVKQKIVRHVGIAMDDDELLRLKELAHVIKAKIEANHQASLFGPEESARQVIAAKAARPSTSKALNVDLKQLREEQRTVTGIHEVYGEIYQQLGMDRLLPSYRYKASHEALFHCVMARIANPDSKRGSVKTLAEDFGVDLNLEKVYRMMDQLDDQRVARLKQGVAQQSQSLLKEPLDVLFFDCTTLYFESFTEDDLKQNGYSKDCKFNQPQVLLALMVSKEGLPVSYEVFPGATFEGHSLVPVLEQMRQTYQLERVVCVADRGLLNQDNLKALEQAGAYYVVGAKLRQLPKNQQQQIVDKTQYEPVGEDGSQGMEMIYQGRRIIVSYSPKRAEKDRHDRQKALQRLQKKLGKSQNPKHLLSNYGYKKFLTLKGDTALEVNEDKVAEAAQWDGLHGVITNLPDTPRDEVLCHYRGLWQVEESFRITKHDLKVRPIYHWKPSRVRAHIAIAFMAFSCVRHLSYRVGLQYRKLSPAVIRNALLHVQHSVLRHKHSGARYAMPSQVSPEAKKIYQIMGLKVATTAYQLT